MNELIQNEIKKNGNTNLITNSGLRSGQEIFAIGDSHAIFFYNSLKIKEHWFFSHTKISHKLPLTIYTLLTNDIDIYNIGNALGNGHELYNIKDKSFVIMFFGFNDMQRNIHLHAKETWKESINDLIKKYVIKIVKFKIDYKIIPIISCIYPNPKLYAMGQNSMGTYEERRAYTIYANKLLKELCIIYDVDFIDIYGFITDEDGFIKQEFTKDGIHLDYDNIFIREYVENIIIKLCENRL